MRHNDSADDRTGDAAVGNVSGDSLLELVLERIEDEVDRVVLFAHLALDMPLNTLERDLKIDRCELALRLERLVEALQVLKHDDVMREQLGDIHRAGQYEHYQALAFRLNLQSWFCAYCGGLMVQRGVGRPRVTCSPGCRQNRFGAGGRSWKDQYEPGAAALRPGPALQRAKAAPDPSDLLKLRLLMEPIEAGFDSTPWWSANTQSRDRALLLLGFNCPEPLTPPDLAALDVNDVRRVAQGLEVRLFKRAARPTRYVTVPMGDDPRLCPVRAVSPWRTILVRRGLTAGPLFVRLTDKGELPDRPRRMGRQAVAKVVNGALDALEAPAAFSFSPWTLFPDFLERLSLTGQPGDKMALRARPRAQSRAS
jgi:hypothetical protein